MAKSIGAIVCVSICIVLTTAPAFAQARFQAADATAIAGLPGIRIVSVRDMLRDRCYLAFVSDSDSHEVVAAEPPDVSAATQRRDRDLADLVRAYENDTSVFAGTITPNPLKYDVLTETVQINFALTVIESLLARLEQQLDRAASATRTVLAIVPDACAPANAHGTP